MRDAYLLGRSSARGMRDTSVMRRPIPPALTMAAVLTLASPWAAARPRHPVATSAVPTVAVDASHVIDLELTADLKIKQNGQQVSTIPVVQGETYTFRISNTAGFDHDFFIGSDADLSAGASGLPGIPAWSERHARVPVHIRWTWTDRLRVHPPRPLRADERPLRDPAMTALATDAICYRDAYLGTVEARVVAVDEAIEPAGRPRPHGLLPGRWRAACRSRQHPADARWACLDRWTRRPRTATPSSTRWQRLADGPPAVGDRVTVDLDWARRLSPDANPHRPARALRRGLARLRRARHGRQHGARLRPHGFRIRDHERRTRGGHRGDGQRGAVTPRATSGSRSCLGNRPSRSPTSSGPR